jgi:DnaJ-class molecular chaperone
MKCSECCGTGYVFSGVGSRADEDSYDECETCAGEGEINKEEVR